MPNLVCFAVSFSPAECGYLRGGGVGGMMR